MKDKAVNDAKEFLSKAYSPLSTFTARDKLEQALFHINNLIPHIPTEAFDATQELDK